jgi:probable phosphoglycerate mutase
MLLLLIRHGDTDATGKVLVGRTPGVHLNQAGLAQAEGLVERLKEIPIGALYSSPLERALETAKPLARARDLTVQADSGLLEVDYGAFTGKSLKQLQRTDQWKRLHARPGDFRFPGGEALHETQARVVGTLERILNAHPKDCVAAFSHGDAIRTGIAHLLGVHLDLYQRIHVGTASVSALLLGDAAPRLLLLNDVGGLGWLKPDLGRGSRPRRRAARPSRRREN